MRRPFQYIRKFNEEGDHGINYIIKTFNSRKSSKKKSKVAINILLRVLVHSRNME